MNEKIDSKLAKYIITNQQEEIEKLNKRLDTISTFIRTHTYSIELERTKEKTHILDLTDEEYDKLMKLVEVGDK